MCDRWSANCMNQVLCNCQWLLNESVLVIDYQLPPSESNFVPSQISMFLSYSAMIFVDIFCSSLRPFLVHCEKTSICGRPPRWIGSIPIPARAYWLSSKLICVSRALVCWIQSDIRCQFWWSSAFGLFFLFGCNLVYFLMIINCAVRSVVEIHLFFLSLMLVFCFSGTMLVGVCIYSV